MRAFPALSYPNRPDMAVWLNGWGLEFAGAEPDVVPSGTFFPEPSAAGYVVAALESGVRIFKAHLRVGGYGPRDPLLDRSARLSPHNGARLLGIDVAPPVVG